MTEAQGEGWETYSADIVLATCKRCTFTMTDCGDVPCPACARDEARTENKALRSAAEAYRDLATCYRVGKQPAEKLFAQLETAKVTLSLRGGGE